jgi:hypothetical protein
MAQSTPDAAEIDAGLCFRDAIDAIEGGMISEGEYFEHLIAHYRGLRHPFDHEPGMVYHLIVTEPVASSIHRNSLKNDYEDFNTAEIEACRKLFHNCVEGDMGNFTASLDGLLPRGDQLIQPVTTLAATRDTSRYFDCASQWL